jgi:hypothetical protein
MTTKRGIGQIEDYLNGHEDETYSIKKGVTVRNSYAGRTEGCLGEDLTFKVGNTEFRRFYYGELPTYTQQTKSPGELRQAARDLENLCELVDFKN